MPRGITVTISFAEPFKLLDGTYDVSEEDKITRTIAIDRTREIKFKFVEPALDANEPNDINVSDMDVNEPNIPKE